MEIDSVSGIVVSSEMIVCSYSASVTADSAIFCDAPQADENRKFPISSTEDNFVTSSPA